MKKIYILISTVCLGLTTSCTQKVEEKPKVVYKEKEVITTEVKRDSTIIKVSDLPVHMEGTKYIIYPVGNMRVFDNGKFSYGSSKTNSVSYAISNYSRYEITGDFDNLKFQHIDSTNITPLTDKILKIQTATYLETVAQKLQKGILMYSIMDADTNNDGRIDTNDIKSLYISRINGKDFQKLSQDYHELIDWNLIEPINRIYFRTIEDINKNGAFDKDDKLHYHYVNLQDPEWTVHEYNPVQNQSAQEFQQNQTNTK